MSRPSVRELIVESAMSEFHRRGFNGCSVEDITKAAGVPKGSFYNHFKSKEELGAETVRRYAQTSGWRAEIDTRLTPLGQLRARFESMRTTLADHEFTRGCLLGNMGTEVSEQSPLICHEVEVRMTSWSSGVTDLLDAAQAADELDSAVNTAQLGQFLINSWEGAISRSKVVKSAEPLDDFFAVVFNQLLTS